MIYDKPDGVMELQRNLEVLRVRLVMGVEEVLGLVMVGWGNIDMVSELGNCCPAPMPL